LSQKKLHIISFDAPIPADYGGIIDVFYRAKALKESGVYIVFHCFYKKQKPSADFSEIADEVYFYRRKTGFLTHLSFTPYIVKSRINKELIERLAKDKNPILAEGHHCTGTLLSTKIDPERVSVRIHNNEMDYYKGLDAKEANIYKKLYYLIESYKLKVFEQTLKKAKALYCLHPNDVIHYKSVNKNTYYWRIGVDTSIVLANEQPKNQVVYIGNLSVNENSNAVYYLVDLWKKQQIEIPLLIAGKNPTRELVAFLQKNQVQLIPNPSNEELNQLLHESKFNICYTDQATGMKIKILHNILKGNLCLANEKMLENSDVSEFALQFESSTIHRLLKDTSYSCSKMNETKSSIQALYLPSNNLPSFF
jgi:hypothetical protein